MITSSGTDETIIFFFHLTVGIKLLRCGYMKYIQFHDFDSIQYHQLLLSEKQNGTTIL